MIIVSILLFSGIFLPIQFTLPVELILIIYILIRNGLKLPFDSFLIAGFILLLLLIINSSISYLLYGQTLEYIGSSLKKIVGFIVAWLAIGQLRISKEPIEDALKNLLKTVVIICLFNNFIIILQIIFDFNELYSQFVPNGGIHSFFGDFENRELFRKFGATSSLQVVGALNVIAIGFFSFGLFSSKLSTNVFNAVVIVFCFAVLFITSRSFFVLAAIIFSVFEKRLFFLFSFLVVNFLIFVENYDLVNAFFDFRYAEILDFNFNNDSSFAENISWYANITQSLTASSLLFGNGVSRHADGGGSDIFLTTYLYGYGLFGLCVYIFFILLLIYRPLLCFYDSRRRYIFFIALIFCMHEFKSHIIGAQCFLELFTMLSVLLGNRPLEPKG